MRFLAELAIFPPKAEVTGSNPVECAKKIKRLAPDTKRSFRALVAEWSRNAPESWPIGSQLTVGRAWCVVGYQTVQIVQIGEGRSRAYGVIALFSVARVDLRFKPLLFVSLARARRAALLRAQQAAGGAPLAWPRVPQAGVNWVRAGNVLCFEILA